MSHTVEIETTFVHGHDNDVVRVIIDGQQKMRGGSWENYYRSSEERNPSASDRLLIRPTTPVAPNTVDNGFLFDDVTSKSYHVDNPAPLHPVVIPQGPKGERVTLVPMVRMARAVPMARMVSTAMTSLPAPLAGMASPRSSMTVVP